MSHTVQGVAATIAVVLSLLSTPQTAIGQATPLAGLPGLEQHDFLTRSGVEYSILVSLPIGYDPAAAEAYPVLYVTDGHFGGIFGPLWSTNYYLAFREQLQPLILVGIVQPFNTRTEWGAERVIDLTPTYSAAQEERYKDTFGLDAPTGGADEFLTMLKTELFPWVESRYAVSERRGIAGHSLGGLFATYVLLTDPSTFSDYLIASPSLWWDNERLLMFELEERYAASHSNLPARVFMSFGSEEAPANMILGLGSLAGTLIRRQYPDLSLDYRVFEGENHTSVVPAAASRGLRYLFSPD
jgi:predicted alpha/beta superfamily hydrolase